MYGKVISCVLLGKRMTEWFEVEIGLRQGDTLSPSLFNIFINGLIQVIKNTKKGVKIGVDDIVSNFFFADDICLVASSKKELQDLITITYQYCKEWGLEFNAEKCKVLVVTNTPWRWRSANYYLGLDRLEVVEQFKYLGVIVRYNLSWKYVKDKMLSKVEGMVPLVSKAANEGLNVKSCVKLWEQALRPVLEYGVETWGLDRWDKAERVQLEAGRRILGVSSKMSSEVVRGELGWWTLKGRRDYLIIKWYMKVTQLKENRLVKRIYNYRRKEMESNPKRWPWGKYIKDTLEELGLSEWWESHGISYSFENKLKKCIHNRELTLWLEGLHKKPKLRLYKVLKSDIQFEDYLSNVTNSTARREVTKLRGGTNRLNIEVGRWSKLEVTQRVCGVCGTGKVEDESHFLLDCFLYETERQKLFDEISRGTYRAIRIEQWRDHKNWMMGVLLGAGWKDEIMVKGKEYGGVRAVIQTSVGRYINRAFKIRSRILDQEDEG